MSPDSEYITLILYTTKLEIDLCNFLAILAVLSILLDTKSNDLQYVQNLQQVVNNYYETRIMEAMSRLEQQVSTILNVMYDSVTKQNFDRVSDDVDRVSGVVNNDFDKIDTDSIKMPYDNANDITTCTTKYNKDTDAKDMVPHDRHDNTMTKVKWSTETNDIDNRFLTEYDNMHKLMEDRQITDYGNRFMREYDNMCKLMEDRQITDYYAAQRHIQSAMMGDTPSKNSAK